MDRAAPLSAMAITDVADVYGSRILSFPRTGWTETLPKGWLQAVAC